MVTAARAYQMLGNESLWTMTQECAALFKKAEIPYGICGASRFACTVTSGIRSTLA